MIASDNFIEKKYTDFLDVNMFINRTIYFVNISIQKFSNYSFIRFASWNTNNK